MFPSIFNSIRILWEKKNEQTNRNSTSVRESIPLFKIFSTFVHYSVSQKEYLFTYTSYIHQEVTLSSSTKQKINVLRCTLLCSTERLQDSTAPFFYANTIVNCVFFLLRIMRQLSTISNPHTHHRKRTNNRRTSYAYIRVLQKKIHKKEKITSVCSQINTWFLFSVPFFFQFLTNDSFME